MPINSDFRPLTAEAVVNDYRIVKAGVNPATCVQAAAAADKLLGTSDELVTQIGDVVDVAVGPVPKVRLGGNVVVGDWLTSDANGKAIATTTAGHQVIGRAEVAGAADDVITYYRALGQL